jgi:predicted dehydrogenase
LRSAFSATASWASATRTPSLRFPYIYPNDGVRPRLHTLCGRDEAKARAAAQALGYEQFCTDWKDLVADPEIDIFDNCGPDPAHVEPTIAALAAGKHVICEKPLAVAVADARRMRDAAAAARGKAMCVFNYRFLPAVQLAKKLLEGGQLGQLYQIRAHYLQSAGHDNTLTPEQVWYCAWPHSGAVQGIGTHAIDQCRYLIGEIKSVSSLMRAFSPGRAVPSVSDPNALSDETTMSVVEFENGVIGTITSSAVATGRKNFLAWEISGSKGALQWDLEHPNSLWVCLDGQPARQVMGFAEVNVTDPDHPEAGAWWGPGHNLGWEHGHIIEKRYFLRSVAQGAALHPAQATFEDGYRAAVVVDAMRASSNTGRRVALTF